MSILKGVLAQLGIVVFERDAQGHFVFQSLCPKWFSLLFANAVEGDISAMHSINSVQLCLAFPFIEGFLVDAEAIWEAGKDAKDNDDARSFGSGLWTEVDKNGAEYQLEAKALTVDGRQILLVENLSETFADRHAVYQKARDIALINEKLISELNYRQRKLQTEIEMQLIREASVNEITASVERNTSGVLVCLPDGDLEIYNKALIDIYKNMVGSSMLDKWITEAEPSYPEIHRVLKSGAYWEGEFKSKDVNNTDKWIRLSIGPVKDAQGDIAHYVCVANDLSDYRKFPDEWDSLNEYDFNTHLPNRRQFWKHVTSAFETNAGSHEKVALLCVDLDSFKRVNDEYGHFAGDFLLSAIASRISRNTKHGDYVAHLGGDEFVILLRFVDSTEDVMCMAERLLVTISEPLALNNHPISITASIGCSVDEIRNSNSKSLLRCADLAMYAAKELGKGQVRIYSDELEDHMPMRRQRENELRDAIDAKQFILEFQPQIEMNANERHIKPREGLRVEALIRWQHPELGLLGPSEFIAIAEDSGMIVPIGSWVLLRACQTGKEMLNQGLILSMAVNVSVKQLRYPQFYEDLISVLEETKFPPERLELEITESSILRDMDRVIHLLEKVRKLGITIALDDFGSGFSSLNYLKRLPIDYIKIDRSFIHDLPDDQESKAITTSVIQLAHQLNMKVIAEGVETKAQLEFLTLQQVDFIQGFYLYRPMSIKKIARL